MKIQLSNSVHRPYLILIFPYRPGSKENEQKRQRGENNAERIHRIGAHVLIENQIGVNEYQQHNLQEKKYEQHFTQGQLPHSVSKHENGDQGKQSRQPRDEGIGQRIIQVIACRIPYANHRIHEIVIIIAHGDEKAKGAEKGNQKQINGLNSLNHGKVFLQKYLNYLSGKN